MNVYKTCCSNHGMKIGDIGGMGEFTPDGYRKRYYEDNREDALIMYKEFDYDQTEADESEAEN